MDNQENSSVIASNAAPKSVTSKKKAPFREVLPKKGQFSIIVTVYKMQFLK